MPTSVLELGLLVRDGLTPLSRHWRRLLGVLAGVAVVAGLALWLWPDDDGVSVVAKGPPTFTFRHPDALRSVPPRGDELVRFEQRRHGRLLASFSVEPLAVPAHTGSAVSALPGLAAREVRRLRRRFPGLHVREREPVELNDVAGETIAFRARRHPRLLGRLVLLPDPQPGSARGVRLLMLARPGDGVASATDVGSQGPTALPYRSFQFGPGPP